MQVRFSQWAVSTVNSLLKGAKEHIWGEPRIRRARKEGSVRDAQGGRDRTRALWGPGYLPGVSFPQLSVGLPPSPPPSLRSEVTSGRPPFLAILFKTATLRAPPSAPDPCPVSLRAAHRPQGDRIASSWIVSLVCPSQ